MTPFELSGGLRLRRVIAGQGMVTFAKPPELGVRGHGEKLLPGRDRLAHNHWAVRERPEWFKPADPKDTATAQRHRALLERTGQALRRQLGRAGTSTPQGGGQVIVKVLKNGHRASFWRAPSPEMALRHKSRNGGG
jgi:hypothetical protein